MRSQTGIAGNGGGAKKDSYGNGVSEGMGGEGGENGEA